MPILTLLLACGGPEGHVRTPPGSEDSEVVDVETDTDLPIDTVDTQDTSPDGPCPHDMVLVDGAFCIDAYEATLDEADSESGPWTAASPYYTIEDRIVRASVGPGRVPQAYISGAEAQVACERAGKHLCSSEEWLSACQGPDETTYPYGDTYDPSACNDVYEGGHPVIDYFHSQDVWDMEHMNDPGINQQPNTLTRGGEMSGCVSAAGAYDMHGNVHEWVSDPDGTFRGGFYADAAINGPGCTYRTTAHEFTYHDYSTGFRCCADPL